MVEWRRLRKGVSSGTASRCVRYSASGFPSNTIYPDDIFVSPDAYKTFLTPCGAVFLIRAQQAGGFKPSDVLLADLAADRTTIEILGIPSVRSPLDGSPTMVSPKLLPAPCQASHVLLTE